jgi:APA family basic amino acid/polyamine antiporter
MADRLPSPALLILAWVLGGVLALAGALTYAEMGAMFPHSGGLYVFLTEAYGPLWGFLFGWAGMLVVLTGSVAAVAVGFAEYFSYFFPALSTSRVVVHVPLPWGASTISAGQLVAASSLAVLGAINYAGVRYGNAVQATFTALKVFALVLVPIVAFTIGRADPVWTPVVPAIDRPIASFGVVMIAVMWAYEGWYYLAFASGEVKDPIRTVPRALVLGTLALTAIYVTVNLAYLQALTLEEMRGVPRIAERAVTALVGASGGALVAATVAISTFGCNASAIIGMSRVCYAMAADGLFFRAAAAVHPRYRTPHVAIVMTCAWAALLTLTGTYEQLFTYVTFSSVVFFVAGGLAIFKLRRSRPDLPRPHRTWGYPAVPAIFVLGSGALVVNTLIERPVESATGLGLVALGLPAYWYWSASLKTRPAER